MKTARLIVSVLTLCAPLFCAASCNQEPTLSSLSMSSDPVIDDPKAEEAKFEDFSLFYVPERGGYLVGDYKGSLTSLVVPDQATGENGITAPIVGLADHAFYGRKGITTVLLGGNVSYIGESAFTDTDITDLRVAGSLTYLGNDAFAGSKVTFYEKDGIEYLPNWEEPYGIAFCDGSDVHKKLIQTCKYAVVKPGTKRIGVDAFRDCASLTSVFIPSSVTSIFHAAFWYCSSLASLSLPASITSLDTEVFRGCSSLRSIDIPSSITSIGDFVFYECSGLTSINLPATITSIGNHAFQLCTSLESITIPSSVTSIGEYAFYLCSSLASITIPLSVAEIKKEAFGWCTSLTINCEAERKPENWWGSWNSSDRPVVWGYKG